MELLFRVWYFFAVIFLLFGLSVYGIFQLLRFIETLEDQELRVIGLLLSPIGLDTRQGSGQMVYTYII